jgi:hypothetical protein
MAAIVTGVFRGLSAFRSTPMLCVGYAKSVPDERLRQSGHSCKIFRRIGKLCGDDATASAGRVSSAAA